MKKKINRIRMYFRRKKKQKPWIFCTRWLAAIEKMNKSFLSKPICEESVCYMEKNTKRLCDVFERQMKVKQK